MRRAAAFRFAEECTVVGFLPPNSNTQGVRFFAAWRAAGEENEIPFLRKQRGGFGDGAFDNGDRTRIEVFQRQTRRGG